MSGSFAHRAYPKGDSCGVDLSDCSGLLVYPACVVQLLLSDQVMIESVHLHVLHVGGAQGELGLKVSNNFAECDALAYGLSSMAFSPLVEDVDKKCMGKRRLKLCLKFNIYI